MTGRDLTYDASREDYQAARPGVWHVDTCPACMHGPAFCGTAVALQPVTYLSIADVARELGVREHTVTMWRQRYDDTPKPDAQIGRAVGWASMTAWAEWHKNRGAKREQA